MCKNWYHDPKCLTEALRKLHQKIDHEKAKLKLLQNEVLVFMDWHLKERINEKSLLVKLVVVSKII